MRPAAAARLGLTAERLAARYPRLVAALITGWGSRGPWADYKGYEALIMAKTGVLHSKRQLTPGPDPAYVSVPYASFAAAQTAVHGILAALVERESSGLGQVVEANLVSGVGALDTYNWFYEMILRRYPDAFQPLVAAFDDAGRPQSRLMYALLVAATKDGTWLQFAQSAPHLTQAFLEELSLADEVREPKWAGFPTCRRRSCARSGGTRCSPGWGSGRSRSGRRCSTATPTCSASSSARRMRRSRTPSWSTRAAWSRSTTPTSGRCASPPPWCTPADRPLTEIRRAPRCDEHAAEIRLLAASSTPEKGESQIPLGRTDRGASPSATRACPLAGVTVLELGGMFAAPFGATVLADLGARVIKVEPLEGDTIRAIMAFPEAGGGKVLQGKESIALDLRTHEGLAIVREIARRCDVVLQCYRAGVAARIGIDEAALKAVNPGLVYLNAPGYGIDGPYGGKPAYAPSIGAASGVSLTDAPLGGARPETHEQLLSGARNLRAGGTVPAVQSDGIAALGVASGLLLGLYAKRRGIALTDLTTTMLGSCTQALIGRNTGYQGRPAAEPGR